MSGSTPMPCVGWACTPTSRRRKSTLPRHHVGGTLQRNVTHAGRGRLPGFVPAGLRLHGGRSGRADSSRPDLRFALATCYGSHFPEQLIAREVVDCRGVPLAGSLYGTGKGVAERAAVYPRIAEVGGLYVVMANHVGPSGPWTGCAGAALWGPGGALPTQADDRTVTVVIRGAGTAAGTEHIPHLGPAVRTKTRSTVTDWAFAQLTPLMRFSAGREFAPLERATRPAAPSGAAGLGAWAVLARERGEVPWQLPYGHRHMARTDRICGRVTRWDDSRLTCTKITLRGLPWS